MDVHEKFNLLKQKLFQGEIDLISRKYNDKLNETGDLIQKELDLLKKTGASHMREAHQFNLALQETIEDKLSN